MFINNPVNIIYSRTITFSFCSVYINFLNFVGRDPSLPSQGRHLNESLQDMDGDLDVDGEAELLEDLVIQRLVILSKLPVGSYSLQVKQIPHYEFFDLLQTFLMDGLRSSVADPDPNSNPDPSDPFVLGLLYPEQLVRGKDPDPDPSVRVMN